MSVERKRHEDVHADVDLDDRRVTIRTVTETVVEIDDLFHGDQLTLWADSAGWSGFQIRDGEYYRVNYSALDEEFISEDRVSREDVVERIKQHIDDPNAGSRGEFRRGATPR